MSSSAGVGGTPAPSGSLRMGLGLCGWTADELFLGQFALSGDLSTAQVLDIVGDARSPTRFEHDTLALALNERCQELGYGRPVRMFHELWP